MNRITTSTNRNSRCCSSGGDVLQQTGEFEALQLQAVHTHKTSTHSHNFVLPLFALPGEEPGRWTASASFFSAKSLHGEKHHELD